MTAMQVPAHYVQLVGTVPYASTDEVFDALAGTLGPLLKRIPDGETGQRAYWITSQARILAHDPQFEPAGHNWDPDSGTVPESGAPKYRLKPGVRAGDVAIPPLGYPEAARASYAQFLRRRSVGRFAPGARFQVSLPTPMAFIVGLLAPEVHAALAPAFEARIMRELGEIVAAIPLRDLAIQWDVCLEIYVLEGLRQAWFPDAFEGCVARLAELGNAVPPAAELGYHFCYGDFRHKHAVEPKDMGLMVDMTNALLKRLARSVSWLHYPVPRDRDDDAYFAPLARLAAPRETELYLGLVHYTDGVEGSARRIRTARRHRAQFGIATECGLGRRPRETIPRLLEIHAELALGTAAK
ncbi:MAG: hypothetical protein U1F37_18615 [Alphaproteobacteria bacterium]